MNLQQARARVAETFPEAFDRRKFLEFVRNLLNSFDESKAQLWNTTYVKDAFKPHVKRFERLGTYTAPDGDKLDVLIVHLTAGSKLERTRTALRNFVADHLKQRDNKDAALVAFVSPAEKQWRFSYVKMEYGAVKKPSGKVGIETKLTPARRYSYIVGEGESCHTAQSRFVGLLQETENKPTLAALEEAFSVEAVTKEFFGQYAALFSEVEAALQRLSTTNRALGEEFKKKKVGTVDFAKKLLGQVVFLYFLQKKGWLGVGKGDKWGAGPHNFLRRLANKEYGDYANFFNDVLEPLFYDTLATDRGHEAWCSRFRCRLPFLNGGLFEPLGNYDWRRTDITLPNELFTNQQATSAGDVGTGILDVFDRYNFTINEAEPLEKEVAIDPEMLGKVFENLIEENRRKGLGSYYTPREIVHYMCQESLVNHLDAALNARRVLVPRADIETLVHSGDQISHYEAVQARYAVKMPKSIEAEARLIDEKLSQITVCDPAVGSGAFPVGMMTEIVRARSALTPYFNDVKDRTPYHFKRHAIQSSLYGTDIDPGAVEIAKLRLWLSLVVDEEDVAQVKPLPNLDYKIVAGNSLLDVPKTLFNEELFKKLEELKPAFFDEADSQRKHALRAEIDRIIRTLTNNNEKFDFELYFSEVFHAKGGFDVVIANPPYLSALEFTSRYPASERRDLGARFETAKGAYDIYVLFMERGITLLNGTGVLSFINPNKYLSAKYAEALREYILQNISLTKLLDVSGVIVFEQAAVYPVVSIMQKGRPATTPVTLILPKLRDIEDFDPNLFTATEVARETLRFLPENIWGFLLSPNIELLVKLMRGTRRLSEVASINASSTASEADEYGAYIQDGRGSGCLKLVNTGTIEPYQSLWGKDWLTNAGEKYLTPYLDVSKVSPRRSELYSTPKLIFAKMAKTCEAFYDSKGAFASVNTNCLYAPSDGTSLAYMAAYCNSRLFMFFYDQFFGSLRMAGGYYQFQSPQLRVIPFKKPDKATHDKVTGLVDQIMSDKKGAALAERQGQIDSLLFRFYGLTAAEIEAVCS